MWWMAAQLVYFLLLAPGIPRFSDLFYFSVSCLGCKDNKINNYGNNIGELTAPLSSQS